MEPPTARVQLTKRSIDSFDRYNKPSRNRQDPPEDPPSIVKPDRRSSNETSVTSVTDVLSQSSISSVDYSFENARKNGSGEIRTYRPEFKSASFVQPPSESVRPPPVPRSTKPKKPQKVVQKEERKEQPSLLRERKINFSTVEVREHAYQPQAQVSRRLGLTPTKELQWQAHTVNYFDVEDYEAARAPRRHYFKNVQDEGKALHQHHEKEDPPNRISHEIPERPEPESRNDSHELPALPRAKWGSSEIGTLGSHSLVGTSQSLIGDRSSTSTPKYYQREAQSEIQLDDYDSSVLSLQEGEGSQSFLYGDYHKNGLAGKKKRRGIRGLFRRRKPKALDDI